MPTWPPHAPFPYETITVPERKRKFATPGMFFAATNHSLDRVVFIPGETVTGAPLIYKHTKNRGAEGFYSVPLGKCFEFKLGVPKARETCGVIENAPAHAGAPFSTRKAGGRSSPTGPTP